MRISKSVINNLLGSHSSSILRKIKINTYTNKGKIDKSLKELNEINKGKNLAQENLEVVYNSNINKKLQESLEHKLSQLNEIKNRIENKDEKDDTVKDIETNSYMKSKDEIKEKKEILLSEDEQLTLRDINDKISETNGELKEIRILGKELSKQSKMIDEKISTFKKMYGNDIFKKAQKEAVLKQVYDTRNNPLIKELKSTFNEILELDVQLKDKLNEEQENKDKKEEVK